LTPPAQATIQGRGQTRTVRPHPSATGTDALTFRVEDVSGASAEATILLRYPIEPPSCFAVRVTAWGETQVPVSCWPPASGGRTEWTTPFVAWFPRETEFVTLTAQPAQGASPFIHWAVDGAVFRADGTEVTVPLDHDVAALAMYLPCRTLEVDANRPAVFVSAFPADQFGHGGGTTRFDRLYPTDAGGIALFAPSSHDGYAFAHWKLDGVPQQPGATLLFVPDTTENHRAVAIYAGHGGDQDGDGDADLSDFAAFQRCFSGDWEGPGFASPSADCVSAFDLEQPTDGDIDLLDFLVFSATLTGPYY
jgi:hypothetical protein